MDFEDWTLGADGQSAQHVSGFSLTVDGNPRDPQGVNPGRFPPGLSVIDQARLLRHGVEAIAKAARQKSAPKPKPAMPKSNIDRPVLSIRRKTSEPKTPA
jgi:hypothetical protein